MQLLGHRGAASSSAPENTLAAVERALRCGADGVEVDVRLTADAIAVVHHDPGLHRTAGDPRHLSSLTWAQVQQLPLAVPRLEDVLDVVAGRGRLVVELKTPTWPVPGGACLLEVVARLLRGRDLDQVLVSSFDRPRLGRLRSILAVRTGLLLRPGVPMGVALRRAAADGHDEAHPHVLSALTGLDLVTWAHQRGLRVAAWTVDRPDHLRRLAAAGVDTAICDDPQTARAALQRIQLSA